MGRFLVFLIFLWFVPFQAWSEEKSGALVDYFDCEGPDPQTSNGVWEFSALSSQFLTPHGHGWRHELKKKSSLRKNMHQTSESLSARVKVRLSPGAKVMIAQYHDDKQGTLMKIFAGDIRNGKLLNGVPLDRVFDLYAVIKVAQNEEKTFPQGDLKSGQEFYQKIQAEKGFITIQMNEKRIQVQTVDCERVYLKFGCYLQAQDPVTGVQEPEKENYGAFYKKHDIIEDTVIYSQVEYRS